MTNLHPDLAQLANQYDQLVAAAEAGHISQADAVATLSGLSVTDATGASWAINADGDYVRSPFPGAPAQVVDPGHFAATAADPQPYLAANGFPAPASAGTFQPDHTASPAAGPSVDAGFPATPGAVPGGFPGVPAVPTGPGPVHWGAADATTTDDPLSAPPVGFNPDPSYQSAPSAATPIAAVGQAGAGYPDVNQPAPTPDRAARSIQNAGAPSAAQGVLDKVKALVVANKVLVAIAAIAAVIFVVLSLQSDEDPTTKLPSSSSSQDASSEEPAATTSTDPLDEGDDLPTDPGPQAASVPTKAMAVEMLSALSSSRRELVASTVAGTPSEAEVAKAAALWAGVDATGLRVSPGAAVAQGQGAVQDWVVTAGETTVATVKVTWLLAGDDWKLATLPDF